MPFIIFQDVGETWTYVGEMPFCVSKYDFRQNIPS